MFLAMRYNEVKGHWPLMKSKSKGVESDRSHSGSQGSSGEDNGVLKSKDTPQVDVLPSKEVA